MVWYIDALMRREGQACYVGFLEAAELHGTMDQAVLEFQVISNVASVRNSGCRLKYVNAWY